MLPPLHASRYYTMEEERPSLLCSSAYTTPALDFRFNLSLPLPPSTVLSALYLSFLLVKFVSAGGACCFRLGAEICSRRIYK